MLERADTLETTHLHVGAPVLYSTIIELAGIARALASGHADGRFTVAEFRDKIGSGRKVAMHILEFFDKKGLTMRREDWRRLNPHCGELFQPASLSQ